jgi:hypothetical protein
MYKHEIFVRTVENIYFHSMIEAFGCVVSIMTAFVLILRVRQENLWGFFPVAIGFLLMGVFQFFHSLTDVGSGFVLLRCLSSLAGGIGFSFVWVFWSKKARLSKFMKAVIFFLALIVICLSILPLID